MVAVTSDVVSERERSLAFTHRIMSSVVLLPAVLSWVLVAWMLSFAWGAET